jgi:hypothetical protein
MRRGCELYLASNGEEGYELAWKYLSPWYISSAHVLTLFRHPGHIRCIFVSFTSKWKDIHFLKRMKYDSC